MPVAPVCSTLPALLPSSDPSTISSQILNISGLKDCLCMYVVCVCVCACTYEAACVWRSEDKLEVVDLRDQTQIATLGSK